MFFQRKAMALSVMTILIALSFLNPYENGSIPDICGEHTDDEIAASGDWEVTGTESYLDENITLDGNLTISGTLILNNVTLEVNSSDSDPYVILVASGGVLITGNNTIITGVNESEYRLKAAGGSTVIMNDTILLDCGISSPSSPHSWKGPYSMTDSFFLYDSMISGSPYGLIVDGGKVQAFDLTIASITDCGISLENGSTANITGLTLIDDMGSGIQSLDSTLNLRDSSLNSLNTSLYAEDSTFTLEGSLLSSQGEVCRVVSSIGIVEDSIFIGDIVPSFKLEQPTSISSVVRVLNTTLDQVSVSDPGGRLHESYRTDFRVVTNGDTPGAGAGIRVLNNLGTVVHESILGPQGALDDLPLEAFLHNITGSHDRNPYDAVVTLEGATRSENFTLPMSDPVIVEIILDIPWISFISPSEGEWLNTNDLLFSCVIEDHGELGSVKLVIDGGSPIEMGTSKEVQLDLSLDDGGHKIEVRASDLDGFLRSSVVNFSVDSIAPTIDVSQPAEGDVVNDTTIWIKGTCSQDAYLYVNDVLTPIVDGSINTTFHLSEGRNQITLFAIDRAGNSDTYQLAVYRDSTPPYLHVDAPVDGIMTANTVLWVKGYTDQSTVRLTINGEEVSTENGIFDHRSTPLLEGENRIVITAYDRTGSMTTIVRRVTLDTTPPSIFLTLSPAVVSEAVVVIKGMTEPGAILTIDGWLYDVVDGSFTAEIDYLSEGSNVLLIRVEDLLGNFAVLEYAVYRDETPPEIVSIDPPSNSHVSNPIQIITGEAYDDNDVSRVMGRFQGGTFMDLEGVDTWKWVVTLESGVNVLEIQALDGVGNVRSIQIVYHLDVVDIADMTPPTVTINKPGNNTIFNEEGLVNFEGTAYDDRELSSVEARIDDGEWVLLEGRSLWHITFNVTSGNHKMEVKGVDSSGNIGYTYVVIRVILPGVNGSDGDDGSLPLPLIIAMVFALLLAVIFGFLIYSNRRLKRTYNEIEIDYDESRDPSYHRGRIHSNYDESKDSSYLRKSIRSVSVGSDEEETRAPHRRGPRPGREMDRSGGEMPRTRTGNRPRGWDQGRQR